MSVADGGAMDRVTPKFRPASGAALSRRSTICAENTETNDELQPALFSSNDWSEENQQVTLCCGSTTQSLGMDT